jgi:hypothetical protein
VVPGVAGWSRPSCFRSAAQRPFGERDALDVPVDVAVVDDPLVERERALVLADLLVAVGGPQRGAPGAVQVVRRLEERARLVPAPAVGELLALAVEDARLHLRVGRAGLAGRAHGGGDQQQERAQEATPPSLSHKSRHPSS